MTMFRPKGWSGGHFRLALILWIVQAVFPKAGIGQTAPQDFAEVASQAAAARDQNDIPRAIDLYAQAVKRKPDWSEGWWFLGSLQYGAGDYNSARDALGRFLALNSNAAPALALRGLCEFETGEYAQALTDIQQGLSLGAANQPRNEKILRYHEAILLTRNARFDDALKAFGFFAHDDKEANPDLLAAIGLAGLRAPLLPKELGDAQKPLFIVAGFATLHFIAGDGKADQAFRDLFEHFPTATNTHYLYGHLLYSTEPERALAEFRRETEVAPANAPAWVMAAWISLMSGRPAEALPYAKRGVEEAPNVSTAQLVLGRSLVETDNIKDGLAHLERALQLEPNELETHLALVNAYSRLGRKDDAKRERLQCLQLVTSGQ